MCNFFTPWSLFTEKNYLPLISEAGLSYLYFSTPSYQPNCMCACLCEDRHTHTRTNMYTHTHFQRCWVQSMQGNHRFCKEWLAFLRLMILSEIGLRSRDWVPKPTICWNPFTEHGSIKPVIGIISGKLSVMMGTRIHHYTMLSYYFNTIHMPLDV